MKVTSSTNPKHIGLYLLEIVKHVLGPFPMDVILAEDPTAAGRLQQYLLSRVLKITGKYTDMLLIATSVSKEKSIEESLPLEIPTNLEAVVKVLKLSEAESKQLASDREYLSEKLQKKLAKPYHHVNWSKDTYQTQSEIYAAMFVPVAAANVEPTQQSLMMDLGEPPPEVVKRNAEFLASLKQQQVSPIWH